MGREDAVAAEGVGRGRVLASAPSGTLYVGVANDFARRAFEHREGLGSQFCAKYAVHRLVRMEPIEDIALAIQREKRLKKWPRQWKINSDRRRQSQMGRPL